jgi:TolA-binding protein
MRAGSVLFLALLAVAAACPALAQSSPNPNALNNTNERLSNQSQIRGIEQQQQFQNNQTQMQIQRNELFRPVPTSPGIAPRSR